MTRRPHGTPWNPPRPRECPSRPYGHAWAVRRWPITQLAGKRTEEESDDE